MAPQKQLPVMVVPIHKNPRTTISANLLGNVPTFQVVNTFENKCHCSLPRLTSSFFHFKQLAKGPKQSNSKLRDGIFKVSSKSGIHNLLSLQNHNPNIYNLKMEVYWWDKSIRLEKILLLTSFQGYFNKIADSDVQMRKRQKENILLIM